MSPSPVAIPFDRNGFVMTGLARMGDAERSLVVYDFDGRVDEGAILAAVPWFAYTLRVATGSGGLHVYCLALPDVGSGDGRPFVVESASWELNEAWRGRLKGFDTRGKGGIIFAPGCRFTEHGFTPYRITSGGATIVAMSAAAHEQVMATFTSGFHVGRAGKAAPRGGIVAAHAAQRKHKSRKVHPASSRVDVVRARIAAAVGVRDLHGPWTGNRAPCVHGNTSSPSIEYYPADGSWFCHKCRVGGDVVALHAAREGISYKAAWHDLIERFIIR